MKTFLLFPLLFTTFGSYYGIIAQDSRIDCSELNTGSSASTDAFTSGESTTFIDFTPTTQSGVESSSQISFGTDIPSAQSFETTIQSTQQSEFTVQPVTDSLTSQASEIIFYTDDPLTTAQPSELISTQGDGVSDFSTTSSGTDGTTSQFQWLSEVTIEQSGTFDSKELEKLISNFIKFLENLIHGRYINKRSSPMLGMERYFHNYKEHNKHKGDKNHYKHSTLMLSNFTTSNVALAFGQSSIESATGEPIRSPEFLYNKQGVQLALQKIFNGLRIRNIVSTVNLTKQPSEYIVFYMSFQYADKPGRHSPPSNGVARIKLHVVQSGNQLLINKIVLIPLIPINIGNILAASSVY